MVLIYHGKWHGLNKVFIVTADFRLPKIQEKPDSLHHQWMRVNITSMLHTYHWLLNIAQSDIPGRS